MFPTLADGSGAALDKVLDRLRIGLLATAATSQAAASDDRAARPDARPADGCHTTGASSREHHPRGAGTAA